MMRLPLRTTGDEARGLNDRCIFKLLVILGLCVAPIGPFCYCGYYMTWTSNHAALHKGDPTILTDESVWVVVLLHSG